MGTGIECMSATVSAGLGLCFPPYYKAYEKLKAAAALTGQPSPPRTSVSQSSLPSFL